MRDSAGSIQGKGVNAEAFDEPEMTSDGSFDHVTLNGESQWLKLTGHSNACFGDVTQCPNGATYGVWIKLNPDEVTSTSYLVTSGGDVDNKDGLVVYFKDPHLFVMVIII